MKVLTKQSLINNYVNIIDRVKEEILYWVDDEIENDLFILENDFMKFRFRTDDNLLYNQKINIPVCVISLSSVIKRKNSYYPNFRLQKLFYETERFKKMVLSLVQNFYKL